MTPQIQQSAPAAETSETLLEWETPAITVVHMEDAENNPGPGSTDPFNMNS